MWMGDEPLRPVDQGLKNNSLGERLKESQFAFQPDDGSKMIAYTEYNEKHNRSDEVVSVTSRLGKRCL